jgi:hypothetical protein
MREKATLKNLKIEDVQAHTNSSARVGDVGCLSAEELGEVERIVKIVEDFCNSINKELEPGKWIDEGRVLEVAFEEVEWLRNVYDELDDYAKDVLFLWESWLDGSEGGEALYRSLRTGLYYYITGTLHTGRDFLKLEVKQLNREELEKLIGG